MRVRDHARVVRLFLAGVNIMGLAVRFRSDTDEIEHIIRAAFARPKPKKRRQR